MAAPGLDTTERMKMKKKIMIAALALLAIGATIAFAGVRCRLCNGTGFPNNSPYPCSWCKGTGIYNGY